MSTSRVRVRPPHSHWGLIAFAATGGAAVAFAMTLVAVFGYFPLITDRNFVLYNSIVAVIVAIPSLAFLIWLPRYCQHWLMVMAAGAIFAIVMNVLSDLGTGLHRPWWYAAVASSAEVFATIIVGSLGAVFSLAALAIYRLFIFRLIEQDGTLCESCGYPVGRSASAKCPECGATWPPLKRGAGLAVRVVQPVARRPRTILASLIALTVVGYATVYRAAQPLRDRGEVLAAKIGPEWEAAGWTVSSPLDLGATTVFRAIEGEDDLVLAVDLAHQPAWRRQRVQVRLAPPPQVVHGLRWFPPTSPTVFMTVPRSEMRNVMRGEVPEAAVEVLLGTARGLDIEYVTDPRVLHVESIELPWPRRAHH